MHPISTELFRHIRDGYSLAHTAYMSGNMSEAEFFKVKKIWAAAQTLLPSKGKAMRAIEKDLEKKYGDSYSTV